jgi:hypothetical protein
MIGQQKLGFSLPLRLNLRKKVYSYNIHDLESLTTKEKLKRRQNGPLETPVPPNRHPTPRALTIPQVGTVIHTGTSLLPPTDARDIDIKRAGTVTTRDYIGVIR